ncbi:MAG: hypothetical protein K2F82_04355, partial [Muribaculaceae bacterium]|nr:hypothetical protein [Muribaculaceae bacterium]
SYLLVLDAQRNDSFSRSAIVYNKIAQAVVASHSDFIANFKPEQIEDYKAC